MGRGDHFCFNFSFDFWGLYFGFNLGLGLRLVNNSITQDYACLALHLVYLIRIAGVVEWVVDVSLYKKIYIPYLFFTRIQEFRIEFN